MTNFKNFFVVIAAIPIYCGLTYAGWCCSKETSPTPTKRENPVSANDLRNKIRENRHIHSLITEFNEQLCREFPHMQFDKDKAVIASQHGRASERLELAFVAASTNANSTSAELQALLVRGVNIHSQKAHEAFSYAAMQGYHAIIRQLLFFSQQIKRYPLDFIEEIIVKLNNAYLQFQPSELQHAQDAVTLLLWQYAQVAYNSSSDPSSS